MSEKMDDQQATAPTASGSKSEESVALRNWQLANGVTVMDSAYEYDEVEQNEMRSAKPWQKDPHYFKEVRISAVALLKMVIHARRGGNLEVMGLMQGRVDGNAFIIMDTFALPVEGTETRVNAQAQAYEYMSVYTDLCESEGKKEKVVGWYHSHPGYGCWLSGIDVATQALNQQFQEPWVAIVVDPLRTMSAGKFRFKVDIGAFRTYPQGYQPPVEEGPSEYQSIPLSKIEDFGVHCKQYYSLDVNFFKSELDSHILSALWSTYWLNTLSSSPLLTNAGYINNQIGDLSMKLRQVEKRWARSERTNDVMEQLDKAVKDAHTVCCELSCGVLMQHIKRAMFNRGESCDPNEDVRVDDEHIVENNAEDIAPPVSFDDVELPDEVVLVEAVN
ncbi:Mov34/MPN/PAD-1 family protein [Ancylostoma ceylanicum]|uniref:Mov34/MPN/PAD-1 family protein n=1 Tax=Ancylostoma ceylanicum TaxID=53326 RepID=A0A0D6L984_9BILA|nr:Mov34/MPN/PAD-1 family protein [Ancylostoma ceylanicum]